MRTTILLLTLALAGAAALSSPVTAASEPYSALAPACGDCGDVVEELADGSIKATDTVTATGSETVDAHYEVFEGLILYMQDIGAALLGDVEGYEAIAALILVPAASWAEHLHGVLIAAFDDPDAVTVGASGTTASLIEALDANTVDCFAAPGGALEAFLAPQAGELGYGEDVSSAWQDAWALCMATA